LVVATDAEGVAPLLRCSDSHAYELTATVRAAAAAIQDAALVAERNADKTVRQIADETGVPRSTIQAQLPHRG
jgi:predicted transcriptional regulator